jgi:hypothetical protein
MCFTLRLHMSAAPPRVGLTQALAAMENSIAISGYVIAIGNSHFFREVAIPISDQVEKISNEHPPATEDAGWDPDLDPIPKADATILSGVVCITVFVAGWASKKALDEIYAAKIGPLLKAAISTVLTGDPGTKKYGISLLINKTPERTSIIIASVGSSIPEIELCEKQVISVATSAMQKAAQLSVPGQAHLYIIEDGKSNEHPWVYPDISSAMQHLQHMAPARSLRHIRAGS